MTTPNDERELCTDDDAAELEIPVSLLTTCHRRRRYLTAVGRRRSGECPVLAAARTGRPLTTGG